MLLKFWAFIFKYRKRHIRIQEKSESCSMVWKCEACIEDIQEPVDCHSFLQAHNKSHFIRKLFLKSTLTALAPSFPKCLIYLEVDILVKSGKLSFSNTSTLKFQWLHPMKICFLLRLQGYLRLAGDQLHIVFTDSQGHGGVFSWVFCIYPAANKNRMKGRSLKVMTLLFPKLYDYN